jgi:electron transport complex protein RnfD
MPTDRFTSQPSSTLALPFTKPIYDGVSQATPLADWKFDRVPTETGDLLLGLTGGSTGETCALLILLGGVYLVARRMMSWRIPLAILLTVALFSGLLHLVDPAHYAGPVFMLFSGGLMLGAVFMATDPVGSPLTHSGCVLFGVLIGLLVVIIRVWGGMPEGVMYSILLANAVSPHIDNWIQPRVYGTSKDHD